MLLTVEGGGFFSSSASGYSRGLALLFVTGSKEERAMRVSPLAQYQLVDGESNPELRPGSSDNQSSRGCASFIRFGRANERASETTSPPKADTARQSKASPEQPSSSSAAAAGSIDGESGPSGAIPEVERKMIGKSCLKKKKKNQSMDIPAADDPQIHTDDDTLRETPNEMIGSRRSGMKKVQWTDDWGGALYEIREFEPSSDEEYLDDHVDHHRRCQCVIQ